MALIRDSGAAAPATTLLYLEHDLTHLDLLEALVQRLPGLRLLPAMQGSIGIDMAPQQEPDLVLLDLHLPDLPGLDVVRQLRADPQLRQVPVITFGDRKTAPVAPALMASGVLAHFTLPFVVKPSWMCLRPR